MPRPEPRVVVFTTVFPHPGQPGVGMFVRERMFRVAKHVPLVVVAPQPWFPLQGLIRRFKPHYRPPAPRRETQDGIEVVHPRFFALPGVGRSLDGFFMALCSLPSLLGLRRSFDFNLIDAHFAYPDGYAASLLGRWLGTPVAITLRGTEVPLARDPRRRRRMSLALSRAARIFAVSDSLKRLAISLGAARDRVMVIGNGVDTAKFFRVPQPAARATFGLPQDARVIVSVGALTERKGFHRVMECIPSLRQRFPDLRYMVVGGPGPEGDWSDVLHRRAAELGIGDCVVFTGALPPDRLRVALSAADVFVLATSNEGWANVLLEAMACGLPIVTTDVGGNAEVVAHSGLGTVVPFGDHARLCDAIHQALVREWNRDAIVAHAAANHWDGRIASLVQELAVIVEMRSGAGTTLPAPRDSLSHP